MRKEYGKIIELLHQENDRLISVFADSGGEEFDGVRKKFSNRIVECGISECNAIGIAAGLAASGSIPIVYGMAAFLVYRAYEFVRDDICLQNLNVKIVGNGAGVIYNNLGPTHHATEDLAVMRVLPNLKILSVASPKEVVPIMRCAIDLDGPVYIRFGKAWEEEIYKDEPLFEYGKGQEIHNGKDITIISTGSIISSVIEAEEELRREGFSVRIINMSTIKPLDELCIIRAAKETGKILVVEEHSTIGGLGSAISEVIAKNNIDVMFEQMGFENRFCEDYGWYQDIKKLNGLGKMDIYQKASNMLNYLPL